MMADETETEDALTFAEMMDFAAERVADEIEDFPGEVPNHAPSLLVADMGNLHGTVMNIQMAEANEEMDDPEDEAIANALEEDVVDILLALGALAAEYDLDVASAFEERKEMMENHAALEDALSEAETEEEQMAALEEHMDEDALAQMMGGMGMTPPPEPGDDVTADDYDPEDPDRHVQ
jgi:hypothetical protein